MFASIVNPAEALSQLVCMGGGEVVESVSCDSVTVCDCEACDDGAIVTSTSVLDAISAYKRIHYSIQ